jgi:hypothetical protein
MIMCLLLLRCSHGGPATLRIMDDDDHYRIRYPRPDGGDQILQELGLNGLPSKETLRDTIEKQWLTPKDQLPEHWLNRYQV